MPINLLTTQLLQTQCQATKKAESVTPRRLTTRHRQQPRKKPDH